MEPIEVVAQAIGIVAMLFNILSYQPKSKNAILAMQLCGGTLFAAHYLLLGATACEVLTLGSIFIGMFRHDRKQK